MPTTSAATRPRFRRFNDAIRAADPNWDRTRTSARCLLAACISLSVAAALLKLTDGPDSLLIAATGLSIFPALTLPPTDHAAHLIRCGAAATVLAWGTALVPADWRLIALLFAALLGATFVRWSNGGRGAGLVAFLGSYFVIVGEVDASGAAQTAAVAGLAVASSAVTALMLIPDRPAVRPDRLRITLLSQLERLIDVSITFAALGIGHRRQARVRQSLVAVQETAVALSQALDDDRTRFDNGDELRSDVLAAESYAEHLVWSVLTTTPETKAGRRAWAADLTETRASERSDDRSPLVPRLTGPDDRSREALARLLSTIERIDRPVRGTREDATTDERVSVWRGDDVPVGRQLIQTLVACGVAIILGRLVSSESWPWATIGAFVVVTTTTSRGSGVRKALDRIIGTTIGAVAGIVVAAFLSEIGALAWALVAGVLFVATWVLRVNYKVTMMMLTVNIALLSELRGTGTTDALMVRLGETAVGAAIGAAVVFFVLPVRTRELVDAVVVDMLDSVDAVLRSVEDARVIDHHQITAVAAAVSKLRSTTDDLRTTTLSPVAAEIRAARLLATATRVRVGAMVSAQIADGVDRRNLRAVSLLRAHLLELRDSIALGAPTSAAITEFPRSACATDEVLRALDDRLAGYASVRGLDLRPEPGSLVGGSISRRH